MSTRRAVRSRVFFRDTTFALPLLSQCPESMPTSAQTDLLQLRNAQLLISRQPIRLWHDARQNGQWITGGDS
jgi:hypothetical protein